MRELLTNSNFIILCGFALPMLIAFAVGGTPALVAGVILVAGLLAAFLRWMFG